jgi:thiosulfate dehydrogenase
MIGVLLFAGSLVADETLPPGNIEAGQKLAMHTEGEVVACFACHGKEGEGEADPAFPRLEGLNELYLRKQLLDYRSGARVNPVMGPYAKRMTPQEVADVSAYYASLPIDAALISGSVRDSKDESTALGKRLSMHGDMANRSLPGCFQCHGPGGQGLGATFPPIVGQPSSYIVAQIEAWKKGTRKNDPLGMMNSVAVKLSDEETQAVAAYLATLPVGGPSRSAGKQAKTKVAGPSSSGAAATSAAPVPVPAHHGEVEAGREVGSEGHFQSPPHGRYPDGKMGDMVRLGEAMFEATYSHPVSAPYVGNKQYCSGCHLDAGRVANSSPMWASWVAYPAYRKKNDKVNTFIERVQGCFSYSMNAQGSTKGHPPAADSDVMIGLVSYIYWLANGAPTGDQGMPGRGYPRLTEPAGGFDPRRGEAVYGRNCAICHGERGEGYVTEAGHAIFPALWGPDSYNWGAGMHRIDTAAAFIKYNMPYGLGDPASKKGYLSDQDAWDVAAYMNSKERPQDPRFTGDLAQTRAKFHNSKYDYYGLLKKPDGKLLGQDAPVR